MSLKGRKKILITSLIIGFIIIGIIFTIFIVGKASADDSITFPYEVLYREDMCSTCGKVTNVYKIYNNCTDRAKLVERCTTCTELEWEMTADPLGHIDGNHENNGKCKRCGEIYQEHGQSSEKKYTNITNDEHTIEYLCTEDGCEYTYPGEVETHNLESFINNNDGTHTATCTICNNEITQEHTMTEWSQNNEDETLHIRTCQTCDYAETEKHEDNINWTNNDDGTHTGTCSKCGKVVTENEAHTMSDWTIDTEDGTKHTRACTTGCGYTETEAHSCNVKDNGDGTHTLRCVKGCGYSGVTADHYKGDNPTLVEYKDVTSEDGKITGHKVIYECAELGCTGKVEEEHVTIWNNNEDGTHKGTCESCEYTKENVYHIGATHANGGKCEYCEAKYETHEKTGEATYEQTENGHKATYSCSFENCEEKIEETEEHSGANHANGGVCEKCQTQYQTHEKTGDPIRYTSTEETHTAIYNCAVTGCTVKINEEHTTKWTAVEGKNTHKGTCDTCEYTEEEEEHTVGEWAIDTEDTTKHTRTCSKCGHTAKEEHTKGENAEPTKTEETETGHKVTYVCAAEGCTSEIVEEHETNWNINDDKTTHTGTCQTCSYTKENEEHIWTIIVGEGMDSTGHLRECDICGYKQQTSHNNEIIDNGKTHILKCMDQCGYEVEEEHYKKENATPVDYKEGENGKHIAIYECTTLGCDGKIEEEHDTKWIATEEGDTHTGTCEVTNCAYKGEDENHTGGTHENGGICEKCEAEYQTHEKTGAPTYEPTENGHKATYECSVEGCKGKIEDTEEAHSGATHKNEGKCEYCQEQYETHEKTGHPTTSTTETGHKLTYACSFDGCEEEIKEEHETKWTDNEDGTSHIGTCATEEGCNYNKEEEHTMGEWTLDSEDETKHTSTCKCGYKDTKDHEKGEATYEDTEEGHKVIYACSVEGCTGKITENHETKWIATEDRTAHTGVCEVTNCGYEKEAQPHSGGSHDNNGLCEKCDIGYQTHEKTGNPTYKKGETGHIATYACSVEGCTAKIEDDEENHIGATHDNGGKCDLCKEIYEEHGKTGEPTYEKIETGHKAIYGCSFEGCTENIEEAEENHSGGNHENGGICGKCEEVYQTHGKTGNPTYKKGETGHIATYACSVEGCTAKIEDDEENHSGATHNNGGVCEKCKEVYEVHRITGEPTYEKTETGHKVIYNCSFEGCTSKIENTEKHIVENWSDEKNGTHSGICSICNYSVTENHTNGITSNCTKCNYTVSNTGNNNNNGGTSVDNNQNGENNNNGTSSDNNQNGGNNNSGTSGDNNTNSGNNNSGTSGDNNTNSGNNNSGTSGDNNTNSENNNGGTSVGNNSNNGSSNGGTTNNNSTIKDETLATKPIPQTGVNSIIIISSIVALAVLSVTMIIKLKGYKDVK